MSEPAIAVTGLEKHFGCKRVLAGLDLSVPAGSVFGLLGLNGAGKSTLVRILLGLARPDAGTCRVLGIDPARQAVAVRQRVGYMAENQCMYAWMRVGELMHWYGRFFPSWNGGLAEQLRERAGLDADAKAGALSKGQASKLALLLALAHEPALVILDDPALGLDPLARRDFLRDVIGQLQARDVTVLFSSHLLYEIEPICDRVAILHNGAIVACEGVDSLRARVKRFEFHTEHEQRIAAVPTLLDVRREGAAWSIAVADSQAAAPAVRDLSRNGVATIDLNLDEIFEVYVAGRKEVAA